MKTARFYRKAAAFALLLIMCFTASAETSPAVPYNGNIGFHKMSIVIPDGYVRDSTQSTDDLLLFETGFYAKEIMLLYREQGDDIDTVLDDYMNYLTELGLESQRTTFGMLDAVRSSQESDSYSWHEILFTHDGATYAVTMQGGTAEEFEALLATVVVYEEEPQIPFQEDDSTMLERIYDYFFAN